MAACPGKSITYGYFVPEPIHCPHCRDAAPPVLTEEDVAVLDAAWGFVFRGGFTRLANQVRELRDRLTGGEGGSRG